MRERECQVTVGEGKGEMCVGFGDFLFDCLANVRWTKAYKQMAVEEVYLLCTIYVRGSWSRWLPFLDDP